jgi:serine/threonine protein kinase
MLEKAMTYEKLGNYEIINTVHMGSHGIAYKARDTEQQRTVYLKIFPPEHSVQAKNLENLKHEVRLALALDHPNISIIFDLDEAAGVHFVAMQHNEGRDVGDLLRTGPLGLRNSLAIAIQVTDALAEAHSHGVVHGDVRPDNILITKDGLVKILDFGIAKILAQKEMFTFSTTGRGVHNETCFTPPEMVLSNSFDSRADIFASGVLLYEMLTGSLPFRVDPILDARHSLLFGEPTSLLKARASATPPLLQQIVNRALAKKPSERYQRIAEFRDDLKSVLEDLEGHPAERVRASEQIMLRANLWVEDQYKQPLESQRELTAGIPYFLLFAIEPRVREMVSSSQVFVEPSQFQKESPVKVELVVTSELLKDLSGRESRVINYYPGNGFPPESFALAPHDEGPHFITVRLFYQRTILYRERIRIDVESGDSSKPNFASSPQHGKETPPDVQQFR